MPFITADVLVGQFCTWTHATGVAANADSTPTAKLVVNGVDHANAVTITAIETGVYRWSVTCPNVADGDILELRAAYTMSSVAHKRIVWWADGASVPSGTLSGQIASAESSLMIAQSELGADLQEIIDRVLRSGVLYTVQESPTDGIVEIVRGASYDDLQNDKLTFPVTTTVAIDGVGYTATLTVKNDRKRTLFSVVGTITEGDPNEYAIDFSVTAAQTGTLELGEESANYAVSIAGPSSSVSCPHVGVIRCLYDVTAERL